MIPTKSLGRLIDDQIEADIDAMIEQELWAPEQIEIDWHEESY